MARETRAPHDHPGAIVGQPSRLPRIRNPKSSSLPIYTPSRRSYIRGRHNLWFVVSLRSTSFVPVPKPTLQEGRYAYEGVRLEDVGVDSGRGGGRHGTDHETHDPENRAGGSGRKRQDRPGDHHPRCPGRLVHRGRIAVRRFRGPGICRCDRPAVSDGPFPPWLPRYVVRVVRRRAPGARLPLDRHHGPSRLLLRRRVHRDVQCPLRRRPDRRPGLRERRQPAHLRDLHQLLRHAIRVLGRKHSHHSPVASRLQRPARTVRGQ